MFYKLGREDGSVTQGQKKQNMQAFGTASMFAMLKFKS